MKVLPITNSQYSKKTPSMKSYTKLITKMPEIALLGAAVTGGVVMKMSNKNTALAISSGYGDNFHNHSSYDAKAEEKRQHEEEEARELAYRQSHPGIGGSDDYYMEYMLGPDGPDWT